MNACLLIGPRRAGYRMPRNAVDLLYLFFLILDII